MTDNVVKDNANTYSKVEQVVVIGGGIIGTTIAERLQHEGKQVLLLDKDGPGMGCSKGNAGHFATDIIIPLANMSNLLSVPKMLLDPLGPLTIKWSYFPKLTPWLMRYGWAALPHNVQASVEALKVLNRPSIDRYQALLKRLNLADMMIQKGQITVYCSEQAAHKNAAHARFVREHGVKVEQLNGDEIRELEPDLSSKVYGGLFYPDTAHCADPYRLVTALAGKFEQAGGRVKTAKVTDINVSGNDHVVIETDNGNIVANEVVIAAGAWSNQLTSKIGHNVPLETERGYHLMLPNSHTRLTRAVSSFERSFVMTPMSEGLRLAGTVELAGLKSAENYARSDILLNHAGEFLSDLDNQDASRWMGHRPSLPDSLPVIGRSPKHKRVVMAFGHQHLGLTQAAVTADLVANEVFNRQQSVDISAFGVDRF